MNIKSVFSTCSALWLFASVIALVLTLLQVANVLSAPMPPPVATGTNGNAVSESLIVINKPIFAPPKGGGLLLATGTNNAHRAVRITDVKQFRVVFPPDVKDGQFSILRFAKTIDDNAGGLKPQHWYKIHFLGTKKAKFAIYWNPRVSSPIAAPKSVRAAEISINNLTGKIIINASSALWAGGRGIGRGRVPLEKMVLDFRLKSGAKERIQFLPALSRDKIVLLGPSTPSSIMTQVPPDLVAVGTRPDLSLALESFRMWGRRRIHLVGLATSTNRRIKAVWINLTSRPRPDGKPAAVKLSCLIFRLVHGNLICNYGHEVRLVPSIKSQLNATLRLILEQQNTGAVGLGHDLRKVKAILAIIAARDKRLRSLRLLSLGVELYPGGPVLETVTFKRPHRATRPAGMAQKK